MLIQLMIVSEKCSDSSGAGCCDSSRGAGCCDSSRGARCCGQMNILPGVLILEVLDAVSCKTSSFVR